MVEKTCHGSFIKPPTFYCCNTTNACGWNSAQRLGCGGLFCFRQFSERDGLALWLQQRGVKSNRVEQLSAFRHTFSYFHLDIVPMWLEMNAVGGGMDEGAGLWYNLAQRPRSGWQRRLIACCNCWQSSLQDDKIYRH